MILKIIMGFLKVCYLLPSVKKRANDNPYHLLDQVLMRVIYI